MIYVPIVTPYAVPLSEAIYRVMRPTAVRAPDEVSQYYCDILPYIGPLPSQWEGFSALAIPDEPIPIHNDPESQPLADVLQVFVQAGSLPPDQYTGMLAALLANTGGQLYLRDLVPQAWQPYQMDRASAIANGFLPE